MGRPNFVFIITDTQGANVVGCYTDPNLRTPSIDRLAQQGIRFARAYTTCPVCTPARASIFSGIYPHTSGPWTNNLAFGDNIVTMGQRMRDQGYHTVHIGKWHLDGHDYFGTGRCPDGWDERYWYDGRRYLEELSEEEITLWRQELRTVEDLKRHNITPEFTWAHRVSDRAIDYLRNRNNDKPFLLVVSYDEPHGPFTCPPEFAEKFLDYDYPLGPAGTDTLEGKPSFQREWAQAIGVGPRGTTTKHPMYFGCNSFVDYEIGRVIQAVDQYASEDTYVIYTSDHGDFLGAHQLVGKGPAMYEEITHIPLIVRQPGQKGAGRVVTNPVSHIDLLPTILDLAGIDTPPILEGESLKPVLDGTQSDVQRDVIIEFNRYEIEHDSWGGFQPIRCIVSGDYKLAINLLDDTDELYNLKDDPHEMSNLINDPSVSHVRDQLHDRLLDWMYQKRDPFRGPVWERRPWRKSRRFTWNGLFRPRPADGYAPQVLDYDTGLPTKGVKVEFGTVKRDG